MKKIFSLYSAATSFMLVAALFFCTQEVAHAQVFSGWEVTDFQNEIHLNVDTSFTVKETVKVDFHNLQKHGIFRELQRDAKGATGESRNIRLEVLSITDKNNQPIPYVVSRRDEFINIRIGDADVYITGEQEYNIEYKVERAYTIQDSWDQLPESQRQDAGGFDDLIEYFWNATGSWGEAPINHFSSTVYLPEGRTYDLADIHATCITGYYGQNEQECTWKYDRDAQAITFETTDILLQGEMMNTVVSFPNKYVELPHIMQALTWFVQDNWLLVFPLIALLVIIILWYYHGREFPITSIYAQWKPPLGMSPGEIGVLIDDKADMKDISAALIHLAIRGYMKIKETSTKKLFFGSNKDYTFIKVRDISKTDKEIAPYEKLVFSRIFAADKKEVKMSSLKNKFYKHLPEIKESLYTSMLDRGLYMKHPNTVRGIYLALGICIGVGGVILFAGSENTPVILSWIVTGFVWVGFSFIMPKKTRTGIKAYADILGLKEYISRAEKYRIEFFNSPEKKPEEFEALLPHAMVLGIDAAWAEEFKDVYKEPPEWYSSNDWSTIKNYNMGSMLSSFNDMTKAVGTAMTTSPSSSSSYSSSGGSGFSGGSFSGGGFGGGGGGSW